MAAKRILMACALAMVFGSLGCQSFCERRYPCPNQPVAYAPAACAPCQQSYAPPPPTWNGGGAPSGAMSCTCVPQR